MSALQGQSLFYQNRQPALALYGPKLPIAARSNWMLTVSPLLRVLTPTYP